MGMIASLAIKTSKNMLMIHIPDFSQKLEAEPHMSEETTKENSNVN